MAQSNPKTLGVSKDPEQDAKHDHLITELESSEGHTASTLRFVFGFFLGILTWTLYDLQLAGTAKS